MPANEIATLQMQIAAAQPGDVLVLATGTYTGRVIISGREGLTLRGAPGRMPVLTLRDPRFAAPNDLWQPLEGDVYRTIEPVGVSVYRPDGRRILWGKTRAHFDQLRGLGIATALREGGATLLYLEGEDPRTTPLMISASDQPVIQCINSPGLRLEGLDVRYGGAQGIDFRGGCDGSVVDGVSVFGGREGIRVKDGASNRVTVVRSWIANTLDERWYYRDVKGNTALEGSAISMPGAHQRIEENQIRGWFNGIGTGSCFLPTCTSIEPIVRANRLRDILDDAIEIDGVRCGGEIAENHVTDAFVGISADPALITEGCATPTRVHHNAMTITRRPAFDRATATSAATMGRPSFTKLQPAVLADGSIVGPTLLDFSHNTIVADAEIAKGAPQGSGIEYPVRIRWTDNVFLSRAGPIVRHTGTPNDGNLFEGNVYHQLVVGTLIENWATPKGPRNTYATLDAARRSESGQASGWEARGIQTDPLLARPGEASSLLPGSPAEGRGAFDRAELRVDQVELLPTGWVIARGAGFQSDTEIRFEGQLVPELVVLSSSIAMGRIPPPPAPTLRIR